MPSVTVFHQVCGITSLMMLLSVWRNPGKVLVRSFSTPRTSFLVTQQRHQRWVSASNRLSASDDNTPEWTTDKVRSAFVEFFEDQEHTMVPSSACAPLNDPTLLFTNAGMNQFKPIFLGQADPNSPLASLTRACNSQKCIRAGGKHNDLEDVGKDTYHHTFFEMLGSWSFGDYFKKEAIEWAWQILTDVYKLNPDQMYATYFQGNDDVPMDTEARDLWLQFLPPERVIGCDAKDNFWEMGDTGPCGPCSEIHYDRIGNRDAAALVNADHPDVIEIWNIVFIQYNRNSPTDLATLPAQHIDTGMGLERLVSILQGKSSNYDIDVFTPLFDAIAKHSKVGPYQRKVLEDDVTLRDTAYRAIADHARALSFAIADGAVPNNEGRGYVLRRILRRATRYGQQILQAEPGFFATLVPVVVDIFGDAYPELRQQQATIQEIIEEEERAFSKMLDRGIKFFSELEEELKADKASVVTGEKAFFLYDTLGFPIDLTELMAEEAGLKVDSNGFEAEMTAQKERSRQAQKAARAGGATQLELQAEETALLSKSGIEPTDDSFKYKWDVSLPATIMSVFPTEEGNQREVKAGDVVGLVLDKTSFYAEAGGQEADLGTLELLGDDGETVIGRITVTDAQAYAGFVLHTGVVDDLLGAESLTLDLGASAVNCKVDYDRRRLIAPNHSMTHVLNAALRSILGDAVDQRGSLCNDEKLRFDFSHKKAMTPQQVQKTEEYCQQVVQKAQPVTNKVMPLAEAKEIDGVRAVFGEVYPDPVRVVSIGDATSVEFCGGTHLTNTAEAGAFVIVEETAVAKGIRRISAVTGEMATEAIKEGETFLQQIGELEGFDAKDTPDLDKQAGALRKDLDEAFVSASVKAEVRGRIEKIQKKANEVKKAALAQRVDIVLNAVREEVKDAVADKKKVLVLNVDIGADSKASQKVLNDVKKVAGGALAFLGVSEAEPGSGGKLSAFAIVPDSLVEAGLKADEWIRATLETCGGRGGGKPGNAQGQAQECTDVGAVIDAANSFAESKATSVA
ncbi:Alanine--tRNA ligase [Seminavis robusta]|uniref:Alanine--tRNA ligase n=1 Tax=Seminavis robusta TaxID=568900 RepID=A0A9N8E3K7_9STRA|nr:Alanine--tRNA ligase [Seminavis robusta]|eukprot:Sro582_g170560.1 Alanine--tRNA ligase (1023) ;mRNA; r:47419-50620